MSAAECYVCNQSLGEDYVRRGTCGHHAHIQCLQDVFASGKGYCAKCPPPVSPSTTARSKLVLGNDAEQAAAARVMTQEREVQRASSRSASRRALTSLTPLSDTVLNAPSTEIAYDEHTKNIECRSSKNKYASCVTKLLCMHDVYDAIAPDSLRIMAMTRGCDIPHRKAAEWTTRVMSIITTHKPSPTALYAAGIRVELLAFVGATLSFLVEERGYELDLLISGLELTFDDLLLLGFKFSMLADTKRYPLIVLYNQVELRAEHIFRFDIGINDVERFIIAPDTRNIALLDINLPYWRKVLGG